MGREGTGKEGTDGQEGDPLLCNTPLTTEHGTNLKRDTASVGLAMQWCEPVLEEPATRSGCKTRRPETEERLPVAAPRRRRRRRRRRQETVVRDRCWARRSCHRHNTGSPRRNASRRWWCTSSSFSSSTQVLLRTPSPSGWMLLQTAHPEHTAIAVIIQQLSNYAYGGTSALIFYFTI